LAARIQTPALGPEEPRLKNRFKDVVNAMATLDPEKYGKLPATAKFPKVKRNHDRDIYRGLKGYMISEALRELESRNISRSAVESNGFKIITTFDKKLMLAAQKAVKDVTSGMSKEFH